MAKTEEVIKAIEQLRKVIPFPDCNMTSKRQRLYNLRGYLEGYTDARKETVEAILNIISDMITDVEEAGFDNPEDQKYIDALEAVTTEIKKKFLGSL